MDTLLAFGWGCVLGGIIASGLVYGWMERAHKAQNDAARKARQELHAQDMADLRKELR